MSTQRQLRRGTNAENEAFTGAVGETVYDTEKNRLVNHDGSTVGGIPVPNFIDVQNGAFTCADGVGTDTITLALEKAPTAYAEYQSFTFKPENNNTGATTINVNSLGARDIKKDDGAGSLVALEADDLKQNIPITVIYDGTQFIAQLGGGGSGLNIEEISSSQTWNKTDGFSEFTFYLWGGGGSGRGTATNAPNAGGGGGGGFTSITIESDKLPATLPIIIGAGGAGVLNANGNAGGDTILDFTGTSTSTIPNVYAKGGSGGTSSTASGGAIFEPAIITDNGGDAGTLYFSLVNADDIPSKIYGGAKGEGAQDPGIAGNYVGQRRYTSISGGNGGKNSASRTSGTFGVPKATDGEVRGGGGGGALYTTNSGFPSGAGGAGYCIIVGKK